MAPPSKKLQKKKSKRKKPRKTKKKKKKSKKNYAEERPREPAFCQVVEQAHYLTSRLKGQDPGSFDIIELMKKLIIVSVLLLLVASLSGCVKKSSVSITATSKTPIPSELKNLQANQPVNSSTAVSQSQPPQIFLTDKAVIDSTFSQNYTVALDDAQKSLRSGVKYCGSKIRFYGATMSEKSEQSFIFYSDEFSKDYYWVVTLNGYQENRKTRSFAARKDLVSELKCMVNTGNAPGIFSASYEKLVKTDQFNRVDPGTIALTNIETMDVGWNITIINNAGESILTNMINSPEQIQTSSPTTTTQ
jgi:hypothetical protein